ncbi:hypothetical protein [Ruegeria arenilitoris]|nr:hypothetical protein [Ruegeria arenilitoris]
MAMPVTFRGSDCGAAVEKNNWRYWDVTQGYFVVLPVNGSSRSGL